MLGPIAPISDALAATAAQASRAGAGRRFDYGWLRAAGSAAFALGTLVSGWQAGAAGLAAAMWSSGALLVLGSAVALLLPNLPLARSPAARPRATMLRDGVLLLRLPVYRRMLVAAALLEGSHALHDSFSVIRWRSAGIDFFTVSALWSESVFAEVVVFLLIGPWLVRRIGPSGSMALAAGRRCSPLDRRRVHDIARAARLHPALARADLRSVPPGGDPAYRGRRAGPPGGDSAGDLRHAMRWFGDRAADIRVGPALCAGWRRGLSAHGCALPAGPADLRRVAA